MFTPVSKRHMLASAPNYANVALENCTVAPIEVTGRRLLKLLRFQVPLLRGESGSIDKLRTLAHPSTHQVVSEREAVSRPPSEKKG